MLRTVRLSGELGRLFGKYHRFDIASPAEAVRALVANFPSFERHLIDSEARGVGYRVLVDRAPQTLNSLHEHMPAEVVSICPVFMAGKSALIPILIGAALIAASFFLPGAGFFAGAVLSSVSLSTMAFGMGAMLVLSGVSQLLSKPPNMGKNQGGSDESKASYYFNGPAMVTAQGGPVPIGYGRLVVGGVIISSGMYAADREP